jgi:cell shape-determining protein MreD
MNPWLRVGWWAIGAVAGFALGGWAALVTVIAIAVGHEVLAVRPRQVLAAATAAMALVPAVWLLSNQPRLGQVSFDLVARSWWPNGIAVVALTALTVGVVLDVLASRRS